MKYRTHSLPETTAASPYGETMVVFDDVPYEERVIFYRHNKKILIIDLNFEDFNS